MPGRRSNSSRVARLISTGGVVTARAASVSTRRVSTVPATAGRRGNLTQEAAHRSASTEQKNTGLMAREKTEKEADFMWLKSLFGIALTNSAAGVCKMLEV